MVDYNQSPCNWLGFHLLNKNFSLLKSFFSLLKSFQLGSSTSTRGFERSPFFRVQVVKRSWNITSNICCFFDPTKNGEISRILQKTPKKLPVKTILPDGHSAPGFFHKKWNLSIFGPFIRTSNITPCNLCETTSSLLKIGLAPKRTTIFQGQTAVIFFCSVLVKGKWMIPA